MKNEISIYLCEQVLCPPSWSWQSDNNGWTGYHIWCVNEGGAHITVKDEEYTLLPGDLFLFDLKSNHICTHQPFNPLGVSTIYFDSPCLHWQTRVIYQNPLLAETVQHISSCVEKGQIPAASAWLEALLSEFEKKTSKKPPFSKAVQLSCQYLEEHLSVHVPLRQLAEISGYSVNQLLRLFQKELGCSPTQFHLRKKNNYAKSQLLYSNLSVKQISDMLGFYDSSYFSKIFKQQAGCSPGSFRFHCEEKIQQ